MNNAKGGRSVRMEGESGQGLGYVLVIGSVLLIMVVAIVDILVKEMGWLTGFGKRAAIVHSADGGIDRAIYALQQGSNWNDIPNGIVAGYNQDSVYTDIPGYRYTLKIEEGNMTPGVQIGNTKQERTITVFATNTLTGDHKKLVAVVLQSVINSAIFSGGVIAIGGSADVQWGPVVSYATGPNTIPNVITGHPIYMSKGGINKGAMTDCSTPQAGVCVNEYATDNEIGSPPVVPINEWRSLSKQQGTYQGGAGACYTPNATILGAMDDNTVVFWDSCDGKDYNPVTDSICSGSCSGSAHGVYKKITSSWGGKGVLCVMGDLETTGTNAMPADLIPPNDCYPKYTNDPDDCKAQYGKNVLWDGLLYVAGSLSSKGNKDVYGTIYAYDTAGITGNFTVWYKSANTSLGYLGKSVMTRLWMERREGPGDVFP